MKSAAKALFLTLSLSALAGTAWAQPARQPEDRKPGERQPGGPGEGGGEERRRRAPGEGRGEGRGQPLTKEKLSAAWSAQATGAAKRLNLSGEQTSAVVRAYTEARESVRAKLEEFNKNRGEGEPGAGMQAMRDAEGAAKEKFAKALADAKVSGEHAAKLNASLGGAGLTGPAWDRMTDTILGMNLAEAKLQSAQNAMEDFVVSQSKLIGTARDNPEAARESRQKAREELTTALKGVLTDEQLKTFEESFPRGGAMRRGPGGERPEGRPERRPGGEGEPKPKK